MHEFEGATYLNLAGQSPVPKVAIRSASDPRSSGRSFPTVFPIPPTLMCEKIRAFDRQAYRRQPEELALTAGASTGMPLSLTA